MQVVLKNQQIHSYRFIDYWARIGGKNISVQSGAIHEENKNDNKFTIGQQLDCNIPKH